MRFTAEQRSVADAIRDFCAKERGTAEQRTALTEGGTFVDECLFLEGTARGLAPVTAWSWPARTPPGASTRALRRPAGHVTQREQFGRTIGSVHAVRHRIADL